MGREIRYNPHFYEDVLAAADWYDERNPVLGADFISKVRHAVSSLIRDPGRRNDLAYGIRYWPVERFPYVVFYDMTDTEILIVGVMHTSQNETKWKSRVK